MATNHFAAVRAFPQLFLLSEKVLHSVFFDEIQILDHAHFVASSVSFVNGFQPVAWKASALKTKSPVTIQ